MKKIYIVCDYKSRIGSKYDSIPYRSGFDKKLLSEQFKRYNYEVNYISTGEVTNLTLNSEIICLYTSSEDWGSLYKLFLEDIIFYLENLGVKVIPKFEFLKAHNNKVSMELLRYKYGFHWNDKLKSRIFGTKEDIFKSLNKIDYPVVIKKSEGAMSKGVFLARNKKELRKFITKVSKSDKKISYRSFKEKLRTFKHKGYIKESLNRNKFILQPFIENLKNDWKILLYGDILFVLTRYVRDGDFRASGSHYNYLAGSEAIYPDGLFDFSYKVKEALNVPHISLDVIYDGESFHIIEFQAIFFGTSTINLSDVYYKKEGSSWQPKKKNMSVEDLYVYGIHHYLSKN